MARLDAIRKGENRCWVIDATPGDQPSHLELRFARLLVSEDRSAVYLHVGACPEGEAYTRHSLTTEGIQCVAYDGVLFVPLDWLEGEYQAAHWAAAWGAVRDRVERAFRQMDEKLRKAKS